MENIGIEPVYLITQIINFGIIVFILTKLLYRPILSMLEKRRLKIEEGLTMAEEMKKDTLKAEEKRNAYLAKARVEAKEIVDDAKKMAGQKEAEILKEAQAEASQIIERAKKEIDVERGEMEKTLKKQMIVIAAQMAEKIIADSLSSSDHEKIIAKKAKAVSEKYQKGGRT